MRARGQAALSTVLIAGTWLARPPAQPGVQVWDVLPTWAVVIAILVLETGNITLDTLRTLFVARGRRSPAWLTGFGQSLLFVLAIAAVLQNLDQVSYLLAYAGGFATGNVLGIMVENRMAPGHSLLRIVSPGHGAALVGALRSAGWGVTELAGRGQSGAVSVLLCYVARREVGRVREAIHGIDPRAFVTSEEVRQIAGGWRA